MNLKFSIIICSDNEQRFLECYSNCIKQIYQNYEIVVVSSSISKEVLDKISIERPEQKHILFTTKFCQIDRVGKAIGYYKNTGIAYSNGHFLLFLDDNQTIDEFFLEFISQAILNSTIVPDIITVKTNIKDKLGTIKLFEFPNTKVDMAKIKQKTTDLEIPSCSFVVLRENAEGNPWCQYNVKPRLTIDFLGNIMRKPVEILRVDRILSHSNYYLNNYEEQFETIITTISNTSEHGVTI